MTSAELLAAVRARLDDSVTASIVSDSLIYEQLSFTQVEFARATLALYDVVDATVTANDPWVTVPSNFLVVKTAILNGNQLRPITASELDFGYYTLNTKENFNRYSDWRVSVGTPQYAVTDMRHDKIRLVPYSSTGATLSLEGYVAPAAISALVEPEIPEVYHELLVSGTMMKLYLLMNVNIYDSTVAQVYGQQWYTGLREAQDNLRTAFRRQIRVMELPRGFSFDAGLIRQPLPSQDAST